MSGRVEMAEAPSLGPAEPGSLEVVLTVAIGTLLGSAYRGSVERLGLRGDERVLDFGSGAGTPARLIAERLPRGHLTCLDVSRRWLDVARRRLGVFANVDYQLGEIQDLGLADGSYEVVFVHFTLHEIPTAARPEAVAQLARVLSPAGRLLLREPLRFIGQDEIRDLMARSGLVESSSRVEKVPSQGLASESLYRKSPC